MLGSQNNKYQTVNDTNAEIDAKLTEILTINFTSGDSQAITVTSSDATRYAVYIITDAVGFTGGAPVKNTLTFPAVKNGKFIVRNDGHRALAVVCSAAAGAAVTVEIRSMCSEELYCDGTDVRRVNSKLLVPLFLQGTIPAVGAIAMGWRAPYPVRIYEDVQAATSRESWVGVAFTIGGILVKWDVLVGSGAGTNIGYVEFAASSGYMSSYINPTGDYYEMSTDEDLRLTVNAFVGTPGDFAVSMVFSQ